MERSNSCSFNGETVLAYSGKTLSAGTSRAAFSALLYRSLTLTGSLLEADDTYSSPSRVIHYSVIGLILA